MPVRPAGADADADGRMEPTRSDGASDVTGSGGESGTSGRATAAYARFVAERPRRALALAVGLTLVAAVAARDVRLDNDFAALFATSGSDARVREEHRAAFGPDDGLLAAVLTVDAGPGGVAGTAGDGGTGRAAEGGAGDDAAHAELVAAVDELTHAVRDIPGVESVDSPTVTEVPAPDTGEPTPVFGPASSLVGLTGAERVALAAASGTGPQFLVADDGTAMLVVARLAPELDSYEEVTGPAARFRRAVEATVPDDGPVRADLAGVAFTRVAAIGRMQGDLLALAPVATVLMAAILALTFRRPRAVLAPLLAMGLALVATAGVIGAAGDDLNQVTVMYPVLLMGIVVAGATHVVDRFYRECAEGGDAAGAARRTVEVVLPGALIANLTTAVGFASLAVARMHILREFGLYLAAGTVLACALGMTVVPALLALGRGDPPARYRRPGGAGAATRATPTETPGPAVPPGRTEPPGPAVPPVPADPSAASGSRVRRLATAVTGRRAAPLVVAGAVAVTVAGAVVAGSAHYDYVLADMLPADDPTAAGNAVVDRDLAGIIPIEVSLEGAPGDFDDPEIVARTRRLDAVLADELDVRPTGVPALLDDLASAGAVLRDPAEALDAVDAARPGALDRLVTADRGRARLAGFVPDRGGVWVVDLRDRIEEAGREIFAGTGVDVHVTGEAPVAYDGMNALTRELVVSTLVALSVIVAAIGLVLRSVRLALVAALANVTPVIVGMGLYALTDDTLDPLPGLVFCVAAGLAADDTVHLITRWRRAAGRGAAADGDTARTALVRTVDQASTAMVTSTLVLVAAFASLALSGFAWNRELGLMGAAVLALALGADLVVTPAALALVSRSRTGRDRGGESRAATRVGYRRPPWSSPSRPRSSPSATRPSRSAGPPPNGPTSPRTPGSPGTTAPSPRSSAGAAGSG